MTDYLLDVAHICASLQNPKEKNIFTSQELADFENECKTIVLKKGEALIEEGHAPKGVYCITSGTAKVFKVGFMGKEQIIRFLKANDLLGFRSIFSNENYGASATALEDLTLEFIPERFFIKMVKNDPKLCFSLLQIISQQLGEAANTITVLAQKTVRERLAEVLLLLEKQLGKDEDGFIKITLTREEMANLIGTATESAIRLISEFKSDGLIESEGRKIRILDTHKLQKLAHVEL